MNIPNFLTFSRFIIALISFYFMVSDNWLPALVLITVSVLFDVLDGIFARKLNQVTKFGIYFDIVIDKIVIIGTYFIIGLKLNVAFFYLGLFMLIREYFMDTMRSIAASEKKVISADKFSKIKGVMFMVSMILMIVNKFFFQNSSFEFYIIIVASVAMLFSYISLIRFFNIHIKRLFV